MANDRAENQYLRNYDLSKYQKKLSFGTFFGKHADRSELAGIYRVLKNVLPCLGNITTNLMHLSRAKSNPIGKGPYNEEKFEKLSENMIQMVLNHPFTKDALVAIIRKLLSDTNTLYETMRLITHEAINLITKVYHLLSFSMYLLGEQMRLMESKRLIGRHLLGQFCKQTNFGKMVEQLEYLLQQYHNIFFRSFEGMTTRGAPRLILDISDVQYLTNGAYEKWTRKCSESEKYLSIRGRMQDLDSEMQGMDRQ